MSSAHFLAATATASSFFFFRVNYFRATAALDNRTQLFVAVLPVQLLAVPPAVARLADSAFSVRIWGSAMGALGAEHRVNGTCSHCPGEVSSWDKVDQGQTRTGRPGRHDRATDPGGSLESNHPVYLH